MPEVGTPSWIEALAASVATIDAGDLTISVLHRVADGRAWRIIAADGAVSVAAAGPGDDAEVTFSWEPADAEAVASGDATALAVFQAGRLKIGGDLRLLNDAVALFSAFPGIAGT